MENSDMGQYFNGTALYGDNFTNEEIANWFEEEKEGYANLGSKDKKNYSYIYHLLNDWHAFRHIKKSRVFSRALGLGSAWGHEFLPIVKQIENLYILEPSDNMQSTQLGDLIPTYRKPNISGTIDFEDNYFDLITCFSTLHHIPNVSYVISELNRVLKPDGVLIIREPIVSMGDWTKKRNRLTKNERGIPIKVFKNIFRNNGMKVIKKSYCLTPFRSFIQKMIPHSSKFHILQSKLFIIIDSLIANLLKWNIHYHARNKFQKIGPRAVFYILSK